MGNYEQLKQAISDVIKTNGNQEITGDILKNALLSIISTIGDNATFAGVATTTTNPGTPDQNVFWIAKENGTYSNFNNIEVENEIILLVNENNVWAKRSTNIASIEAIKELKYQFNVSRVYPNGGVFGDTRYNFDLAKGKVPSRLKLPGLELIFIDENSILNTWEYVGGGWDDITKWIPTDGTRMRLYANKYIIITAGDFTINFSEKKLVYTNLRAISQRCELLVGGGQTMTNAELDFSSVYSTLPVNAAILINPNERTTSSSGLIALSNYSEIDKYISLGWYILGYIRTVDNKFIANIDKYNSDGKVYYNNIAIKDFITDDRIYMKYVSPSVLGGIDVPYIENKILKENGEIRNSSLNVTEPIIAFPGMILHDVRTPGDTSQYCAIVYYDINDDVVGTYKSVGGSIIPLYKPELPENCLYLRYSTDKTDKPKISYEYKILDLVYIIGSSSVQRMETRNLGEYKLDKLINNTIIWSGVGGEDMQAVTARGSIYPIFPTQEFNIPNDTTEVNIQGFLVRDKQCTFTNQQGNNLPKLNPVTINGIKGNIRYDNGQYLFKREIAGNSVKVTTSNVIVPNNIIYRGQILITMLGYNKGYETTEEYVECHKKAVEVFTTHKYLLITRLVDGSWTNISTIQEEELALLKIYGANVFALREWLSSEGMRYAIDLGLLSEETEQDIQDRLNGYVPTSLRDDAAHLTDIGYMIVSYKISEILKQLNFVENEN